MNIGFDFDGVIREGHLGVYLLGHNCEHKEKGAEAVHAESIASCKPLLNPLMFATKSDKIYIISACTTDKESAEKRVWLEHFYGKKVEFVIVPINNPKIVAADKIAMMESLGIEVYFDDNPNIIREMRKLSKKIKFIHYGSYILEE